MPALALGPWEACGRRPVLRQASVPAAWRAPPGVGPALEGVLPGGGGEPTSGRRGGEGPADGGAWEGGGHPPGSGERAVLGAVRSAVPGPPPLLWVTGGSLVLVFRGLQVSGQLPRVRASVSVSHSPGRGDSPSLRAPGERVTASPGVWGGWRCRLLEALPGLRGGPAKP